MLSRTAHHVASPVILDFLIPHTILRRSLCYTSIKNNQQTYSDATKKTPSTPSSSSVTPDAVLTQLEEHLRPFDSQPLASLTNSQVHVFNATIPQLHTVFQRRDIVEASKLWSLLKTRNVLAFFGLAQYGLLSRLVAQYLKHSQRSALHGDEERTLVEMALVAAAGGVTGGLRALMFSAIQNRNPRDALALYNQYLVHLQDKGLLQDDPTPDSAPAEESDLAENASFHSLSPTPSPIRDEILLCAVVAHAQLDAFADALSMYLKAALRISHTTVEEVLPLLQLRPHLKVTVLEYVRRLDTAALLSRPEALMKHTRNLTKDSAYQALEKLYSHTIAGLHGSHPWIALRPEDLSGTRIIQLPRFFWTSFLGSFLACRRTDLAERLWNDMLHFGIVPEVAAWNTLLDGYAKLRSVDAALSTWNTMVAQNVKPDPLSHRAIIHALMLAGRYEDALTRFAAFGQEIPTFGLPPDDSAILAVHNTLLHDLLFASQEERAKAVLEKMEAKGPKPDIVTYNTFLRYHRRKGDLKAMADILQKLKPAGLTADMFTFSTLLSAMLRVRPDADRMMINFMKKQGVVPNTTALTSIIDHQLQEGTQQGFKTAMDLLGKMERNEYENVEPNAITYTSVLTAINRGNWLDRRIVEEYNLKILETMRRRGIQPTRATYNVLLRASLSNREPEGLQNALTYYKDMVGQRVYMGNDTWYILLQGLMDRGEIGLANEVVKDLRRIKMNNITGAL